MKRILHLVRHGQVDRRARAEDSFGWSLTPLGREQAERTAKRLQNLPIRVIHHSSLRRATETAQLIKARFPEVPLCPSELLHECVPFVPQAFRDWHAESRIEPPDQHEHEVPIEMRPWLNLWNHHVALDDVDRGAAQAEEAFVTYFTPPTEEVQHEVIVCHGIIMCYFVCRSLGAPPELWMNTDVANCGISEVLIRADGTMMLSSHNDTGHLPYTLRTDNEHSAF